MTSNHTKKGFALLCALALTAAACGGDDDATPAATDAAPTATEAAPTATEAAPTATEAAPTATEAAPTATEAAPTATEAPPADDPVAAAGLWNDGPCDSSLEPLKVGLITVFASPVLTLGDQAVALEASAKAFNARGGASGHCVEVTTCDDGADPNKAVECVKTLQDAGVAATINDTTSFGGADVSAAMAAAGIPRFAISPGQDDFADTNSYPFDAGGTGTSVMMGQPFVEQGLSKIAIVRVDAPAAGALAGFYGAIFGDNGLEVVADLPVAGGTTDYTQFILAAQDAGAEGIVMPIGGQEGIQVLRAGQQLDADLQYSSSLGTFPAADMESLGEYASRVTLNAVVPPAGADLPIIDVLTADLAASGEEILQRQNMKASPMRSWVGLYALIQMIRDSGNTDFTAAGIKAMIEASGPIPMLGLMPDWTPKTDHEGLWLRAGGDYSFWAWDDSAKSFTKTGTANWDVVICGTPFGGACK
jgi:ABC-type branched-subunit amino acid transport system substrate-binding protein